MNENNQFYIVLHINATENAKLSLQHFTPNGVPNGQRQQRSSKEFISLSHDDLVELRTVDGVMASFRIDLSEITERQEINETMVASSESRAQDFHTPQPILSNSVSVIRETPAASRVVAGDISIRDSVEPSGSEPYSKSNTPESGPKRQLEDLEDLEDERPSKKAKSVTSTPNPPKRGRPRKQKEEPTNPPTDGEHIDSLKSSSQNSKAKLRMKLTIVFSGSTHTSRSTTMSFLKKFVNVRDEVTSDMDFLCIGKGQLRKTSKLLKAVVLGKPIIDDQWVTQCLKSKNLVDHMDFIAHDEDGEAQSKVPSSWSDGTGITTLLKNKRIYVTPAVRKDIGNSWSEFMTILTIAGATKVANHPANDLPTNLSDWICIGQDTADANAYHLWNNETTVYHRDLLSLGILRSVLDLESDEFRLNTVADPSKSRKKGMAKR
jgi:hypothetical protein